MALDPRRLITCRGCAVPFSRDPNQPKRQYCTWGCFKASRHVEVKCSTCGVLFSSYLSEQRKREDRGHVPCCSRACRNSYTSKMLGGDGTWVVGGRHGRARRGYRWRTIRLSYLCAVSGTCEGCGVKAQEVHHLHPIAGGGEPYSFDNLMAVCQECHRNMHEQLNAGAFACSIEAANANL